MKLQKFVIRVLGITLVLGLTPIGTAQAGPKHLKKIEKLLKKAKKKRANLAKRKKLKPDDDASAKNRAQGCIDAAVDAASFLTQVHQNLTQIGGSSNPESEYRDLLSKRKAALKLADELREAFGGDNRESIKNYCARAKAKGDKNRATGATLYNGGIAKAKALKGKLNDLEGRHFRGIKGFIKKQRNKWKGQRDKTKNSLKDAKSKCKQASDDYEDSLFDPNKSAEKILDLQDKLEDMIEKKGTKESEVNRLASQLDRLVEEHNKRVQGDPQADKARKAACGKVSNLEEIFEDQDGNYQWWKRQM